MLKEFHTERDESGISAEEISALVHQAQGRDEESFAELLRIFEGRLHRQALFLTGHEQQALDLLQETSFHAWRHLGRFDGRASLFTWMCSIMVHRHYDWLRRLRTRAFAMFPTATEENQTIEAAAEAATPREVLDQIEQGRLVRECLDELPAAQRMVVYLRFYTGESLEGIAAATDSSIGTVKSRLFHALKRLAKMRKIKQLRNTPENDESLL